MIAVAILASGPSMSAEIAEAVRASRICAYATNNTHRLAPWASVLYAADVAWWEHPSNADAWSFAGEKFHAQAPSGEDLTSRGVRMLRVTGLQGYDPTPGAVRTGGNSGYQAVHLALQRGATRIMLFGFDFKNRRGAHHWHGSHPAPLRNSEDAHLAHWARRFDSLVEPANLLGANIINCTPDSAISAFPFRSPELAIAESAESHPGATALSA